MPESPSQFSEENFLPLSVLADLLFCERRAALHQIEGIWEDNLFTVEGSILHHKADGDLPVESRGEVRVTRGLLVRSLALGLTGKADVVEFHHVADEQAPWAACDQTLQAAISLKGVRGLWRPFPVEYKRGRLRHEEGFEVQLCAQALCIEEMLSVAVPAGAIYYGKPHRRLEVVFDAALREKTKHAATRLHELIRAGKTPPARFEKKCKSCSLFDICMPRVTDASKSVSKYLARMLGD